MMRRTYRIGTFVVAILLLPAATQAATMSLIPSVRTVNAGDIVTVRVAVDPGGTAVNNAEAILHFPAAFLEVLSISKAGSLFPLWVEDPSFSNAAGTVSFNGGVPNPGVSSAGTALSVSFHALHPGTASLSLSDAAVRANDGNGTDVLSGAYGTQIAIAAPAAAQPGIQNQASAAPLVPGAPAAGALTIVSPTHPDQTAWYADAKPTFTWKLPANATSVQLGVDTSEKAAPTVSYANPLHEKTVDTLGDGTWYFSMRYRAGNSWSAVSTYRVNIDASAPSITSHDFIYDGTQNAVLVDATGTDSGSGIVAYAVSIDGAPATTIPAEKFAAGPQPFPIHAAGVHRLSLTAFDAAGNQAALEGSFSVPPSLDTETLFHIGSFGISLLAVLVAMGMFSLLSLALALFAWHALMAYRYRRHPTLAAVQKGMHQEFLKLKTGMKTDLRALDKARAKRALSKEEETLYRRLTQNVNSLEHHLDQALDEL